METHGGKILYFTDTVNDKYLMQISANTPYLDSNYNLKYKNEINILDNLIVTEYEDSERINIFDRINFYKNLAGSNSFKIGDDNNYVLMTDNGAFSVQGSESATFGISGKGIGFDVYPSVMAEIWGPLNVDGNVYAKNISSDRRLKKNIKDSNTSAIDTIKKIRHRQFEMKEDNKHYDIGYIAQELEEINKNFVLKREETEKSEERYFVNELPLIATATKAIQEQQEQIEQLQEKYKQKDEIITDLIKRIETLEKEVNK